MPMTIENLIFEEVDLDSMKVGELIKDWKCEETNEKLRPMKLQSMRLMINEIGELYKNGKGITPTKLKEVWERNENNMNDYMNNFLDTLENKEDIFKISKKQVDAKGNITLKLEKVDTSDRNKLIKEIANKLIEKLDKEQLRVMIEEGLKKNNDFVQLKKANIELDKKKPKIKEFRGCYKIVVNDTDLMIIG